MTTPSLARGYGGCCCCCCCCCCGYLPSTRSPSLDAPSCWAIMRSCRASHGWARKVHGVTILKSHLNVADPHRKTWRTWENTRIWRGMSRWIWQWKLEGFQGYLMYLQSGRLYTYTVYNVYIYIDISQVGVFLLDFDKTIYILILCFAGFFQVIQLATSQFHLN